jgi:genome maintenance exonuclease 1
MAFTHLLHPEIPKIKQINIDGIRHYETPDGTLISITSLLKNFTPQGILDWRKAVGEEVANAVMIAATDRGSKVHQIIENCLSNKSESDLIGNYGELAAKMFSQMIPALDKVDRIRALEKGLYSTKYGIAGRVDCIAEYDKELTVIDFKTATRKRDERNENYLVQASFYSVAWEERTGEKVDQIAILTTTEDGELDVYRDDPSNYIGRLEEMIEEYKTGKTRKIV